jgi:hypothetical protein
MSMERFPTPQEIRDAVAGKAGTRQQLLTFIRLWQQAANLVRTMLQVAFANAGSCDSWLFQSREK